jgi:anti-anti-sigma factor
MMVATFERDFPLPAFSVRFADAVVFLRLEGEIDSAAQPVLADVALAVNHRPPARIFVDLGGVSFAGSTLINFLDRVAAELPAGSTLVLCRPEPAMTRLIQLTHLDTRVELHDDLPTAWPPDLPEPVNSRG